MTNFEIVTINKMNLSKHPEVICFINPKNSSYSLKVDWIKQRLTEGLCIKLLYREGSKRAAGFIEYVPGENAWRAVDAKDYMFIHCLYVYPNENKGQGLGSYLIHDCLEVAKANNYAGVAVVASSGSFMAGNDLFLKTGFKLVQKDGKGNELLMKQLHDAPAPYFHDWMSRLREYSGLNIIYSRQCPWVARMIEEIHSSGFAEELNISITELKTPAEAQQAPSVYAVFNLINNGKLLADRYISMTRFKNILRQEKLI